jgi:hypothetical protein
VQAPHKAAPQPNLVPVRPTSSRITHNNGVSGSAWTVTVEPFRLKLIAMLTLLFFVSLQIKPTISHQNYYSTHPKLRRFYCLIRSPILIQNGTRTLTYGSVVITLKTLVSQAKNLRLRLYNTVISQNQETA